MGMDSLTSVELKSRLESALGKSLPTTMALEYPTIEQLVRYLEAQILPTDQISPRSPVTPITELEGDDFDRHSREELLDLLAAELRAVEEQGSN
jgi:myxalamid-type polyketide synthase MxaB